MAELVPYRLAPGLPDCFGDAVGDFLSAVDEEPGRLSLMGLDLNGLPGVPPRLTGYPYRRDVSWRHMKVLAT